MNQDQINSLTRSLLKMISGAMAAHGLVQASITLNRGDVIELIVSTIVGVVAIYGSHKNNADAPTVASTITK